ncbi:sigma-54 dependent transcriptional regulator [Candidatus Poribacteria bacterium]|nr:sigma-54 dependent transcriptional regulator [Candidatus Poribacteria bacterium]
MNNGKLTARILIVDDEVTTCQYIDRHLQMEENLITTCDFAHNIEEAIDKIDTDSPYDILFVDLWMPSINGHLDQEAGIKVLKYALSQKSSHPKEEPPVAVIITANSSIQTALETSGLGVYDYISKPIDFSSLMELTQKILLERQQKNNPENPTSETRKIIGKSRLMIDVVKKVGRIAHSDSDVLIYGETGTGKDLIAQAIHKYSPRSNGPFIVVNCSAIPSEMIESELFGIGKRVATSVDHRKGKFEQAHGGSIFLDEIGDLSLDLQPKLLRVLDYKEIQGVGQTPRRVDVRVIAATNRNLSHAVSQKQFRSDLFYRLSFMIELPPLRDRKSDIPLLAQYFLGIYSRKRTDVTLSLSSELIDRLQTSSWVGNVRELEKVIEYATVTCQGNCITENDLPPWFDNYTSSLIDSDDLNSLTDILQQDKIQEATESFERFFLRQKLAENNWNILATAEQVGIRRQSLHRKINRLRITPPKGVTEK